MIPRSLRSLTVSSSLVAVALAALDLAACFSGGKGALEGPHDAAAFDGFPFAGEDAPTSDGRPSTHDGSTPDAAGDAPAVGITLTASTTSVTTAGNVTLTATVTGATPLSVEFDEGTASLGTATAAPFHQVVSFAFPDSGTHTYVAKATLAGNQVLTSAPLAITLNIAPNGFFVDPAIGADTNPGTPAAPFKTIQKAAMSVTSGQTIYLAAGMYDSTTQPQFTFTFNTTTFVRGLAATGVILSATTSSGGFYFNQGGGIRDIAFQNYLTALQVNGGTFTASGLTFSNVVQGIFVEGTATATIDESNVASPVTHVPGGGVACLLTVDNTGVATLKATGAVVDGVTTQVNVLFARGHGNLTVDGLTIRNVPGYSVVVYDNASVTLKNVVIDSTGLGGGPSGGYDKASIAMGGQNTEVPLTTSLELDNTQITKSPSHAIILSLYGNTPQTPTLTFSNSHIDSNMGHGLWVTGSPVDPNLVVAIHATNTTFSGNAGAGVTAVRATLDMTGGAVSNNTLDGITITDAPSVNTLKVRQTAFSTNGGDSIAFAGTAGDGGAPSVLNLGMTGDPGNIVFTGVPTGFSAVRLDALIPGFAVGNTWIANQQGANASGMYASPTMLTGTGTNATVAAGASLVVE